MCIDQHAQHAVGLVGFDKTHSSHVGRQVEHFMKTIHGLVAILPEVQVQYQVIRFFRNLVPLVQRLLVHGANHVSFGQEGLYKMPADKSAGPGNNYSFHHD